ncbi:MAG: TorF family putative porin, partial [Xanthobacteraceae bacterium]
MKRVALPLLIVAGLTTSALAADVATKAPPAPPPPPPSPWDVAITAALMNDYNFRGITQSRHQPSTQAGFELRYTFNPQWQWYAGISGESIDFPNHAAAEIDFYGGVRPTFGKLALDFGAWYYWYPGGECFNGDSTTPCNPPGANPNPAVSPFGTFLPNGNVVKGNLSFVEIYGKA